MLHTAGEREHEGDEEGDKERAARSHGGSTADDAGKPAARGKPTHRPWASGGGKR